MHITPFLQRLLVALAVLTACGMLVHDTKFDKAIVLALPVAAIAVGLDAHAFDSGDSAHTHVERVSISHVFSTISKTQARDDHRRYQLPKYFKRNSGFFGDSYLFWPSI